MNKYYCNSNDPGDQDADDWLDDQLEDLDDSTPQEPSIDDMDDALYDWGKLLNSKEKSLLTFLVWYAYLFFRSLTVPLPNSCV